MSTRVAVLALDGCMASAVSGILDVLRVANQLAAAAGGSAVFAPCVVRPTGGDVVAVGGLPVHADASLANVDRRFRAATGESPVAYLHRVRIEAAKRLLEGTRADVDEITAAVGYGDSRSFSRLFRRLTGLAPREYRRRFGIVSPGPPPRPHT